MQMLHKDVLVQPHHSADGCAAAICAKVQHIVAFFQHGTAAFFVKGCQLLHGKAERQCLAFAGGQLLCLGKGCQRLIGLGQYAAGHRHIQLCHLFARPRAGVGDGDSHPNLVFLHCRFCVRKSKLRIGKAITKGKQRSFIHRVKIAVAHIDTLFVAGVVGIAKLGHGAVVLPCRPCGSQLTGGIGFAQQYIGKGVAHRNAGLGDQQDVGNLVHHRGQIHHAAHIQHQHKAGILLLKLQNVPHLGVGEQQIPLFRRTVCPLAADAPQHIHGGVSLAGKGQLVCRLCHNGPDAQHDGGNPLRGNGALDAGAKLFVGLIPNGVIAVQPAFCGDGKARVFQAFLHRDIVAGVHIAGTGAALDGLAGGVAVQGDFARRIQREAAVRFQQHHTFRGKRPYTFLVFHFVVFHEVPPILLLRSM